MMDPVIGVTVRHLDGRVEAELLSARQDSQGNALLDVGGFEIVADRRELLVALDAVDRRRAFEAAA